MIKIFQHRANDPLTPALSNYAEIDVQINDKGDVVVKHDPDQQITCYPSAILHKFDGFLVDIKQNMPRRCFDKIATEFGNKLMGFIDVPYPCLAEVRPSYKVWERYSGEEKADSSSLYLDPLFMWHEEVYKWLLNEIESRGDQYYSRQIIVAAPDLHGAAEHNSLEVISALTKEYSIHGVITKYPVEMKKALQC